MKKPTISSDVGGISDLIDNGVTGFLFENGNFKEFGEKIVKLSMDKSLQSLLGENLYNKASYFYEYWRKQDSVENTMLKDCNSYYFKQSVLTKLIYIFNTIIIKNPGSYFIDSYKQVLSFKERPKT